MLSLFVMLVLAFFAVTVFVLRAPGAIDELAVTRRVQALTFRGLGPLLRLINLPGYPPQVFVLSLLLVLVPYLLGWKWIAVTMAFVTLGVGLTATLVKQIVQRPRPTSRMVLVHRVLDGGGASYPAGHCADYLSRFGFIIYLLAHFATISWWVWLIIAVLAVFIALVGLARVYTGEHWVTDVLGGYLLGGIWLFITIYFYDWTQTQNFIVSFP